MASHDQSTFTPTPPSRTSTFGSQASTCSAPLSPSSSRSPSEDTFFSALTARMRLNRSRSRAHSNSPMAMAMPPQRLPSGTSTHTLIHQDTTAASARRAATAPSTSSSTAAKAPRPGLQGGSRRPSGGDPWRGRHSNSWLFNDFSVTGTAKSLLERRRS